VQALHATKRPFCNCTTEMFTYTGQTSSLIIREKAKQCQIGCSSVTS
jgi:hypothetical protein